jgi:hypothetical protein
VLYLKCIRPSWLQHGLGASVDRLAEAWPAGYDPRDAVTRIGPWRRGMSIPPMTMQDMVEQGPRVWQQIG